MRFTKKEANECLEPMDATKLMQTLQTNREIKRKDAHVYIDIVDKYGNKGESLRVMNSYDIDEVIGNYDDRIGRDNVRVDRLKRLRFIKSLLMNIKDKLNEQLDN